MADDEESGWLNKTSQEALWEEVQKKTFCGWVNLHLKKRNMHIGDLEKDLGDGVKLIALLEILGDAKIEGRYYRNPKSKPYKIDNVNFALTYIADTLGVKLISCSAEDVVDGNIKIILGMVWKLIQKFQLPEQAPRQYLLSWVRQVTNGYAGFTVDNFHRSFKNGLAFCAVAHAFDAKLLDFETIKQQDAAHNLTLAFDLLEAALDVPALLDPADISRGLADERSVMTYTSMLNRAFLARRGGAPASSRTEAERSAAKEEAQQQEAAAEEPAEARRLRELEEQNSMLMRQLEALQQQHKELAAAQAAQAAKDEAEAAAPAPARAAPADESEEASDASDAGHDDAQEDEAHAEPQAATREEEEKKEETQTQEDEAQDEKEAKEEEEKEQEEEEKEEKEEATEAARAEGEEGEGARLERELQETRASLRQQIQVGETLQKSLEDAREELGMVQKKHRRAVEKALKKQQKKHDKRLQRRDRELEALKANAATEQQQRAAEVQRLQAQLAKAHSALGQTRDADAQTEVDDDIAFLKQEFAEVLAIAQEFEEEEQQQLTKASHPRTDDMDDEDGAED